MARGVWVDRCGDRGSTASCESEWESILVGTNKVAFSGYKMQPGVRRLAFDETFRPHHLPESWRRNNSRSSSRITTEMTPVKGQASYRSQRQEIHQVAWYVGAKF